MIDLTPNIASIYRYPFKGLTGEKLPEAHLSVGQTLPFDRAFAFENGNGKFDPNAPRHLPKTNFLMLMRNEKLATLSARFEDASQKLTLSQNRTILAQGHLNNPAECKILEDFIADYLDEKDLRGRPHIVQATQHSFSDVKEKCLHIINLASLRALEEVMNTKLNPLRFRANIYLDGLKPWEEFDWLNQDLILGTAKVHAFKKTVRCLATNVDPNTGQRDKTNIPMLLKQHFGHSDLGIYAQVSQAGLIKPTA